MVWGNFVSVFGVTWLNTDSSCFWLCDVHAARVTVRERVRVKGRGGDRVMVRVGVRGKGRGDRCVHDVLCMQVPVVSRSQIMELNSRLVA